MATLIDDAGAPIVITRTIVVTPEPVVTGGDYGTGGYGQGLYYGDAGVRPAGITDPDSAGAPAATYDTAAAPTGIADDETLGGVGAGNSAAPTGIIDPENLATPTEVYPTEFADGETLGAPKADFAGYYTGGYGTGSYGRGLYGATGIGPETITDADAPGAPALSAPDPVPTDTVLPLSITDPDTPGAPAAPLAGATNYPYGAGEYGAGTYYGSPGTATDANPSPNPTYGTGTYGYGDYYAQSIPHVDAAPLFGTLTDDPRPALHILGIGPWSPAIDWRGVPNQGIRRGKYPARPAVALPPATSKGFTLRLNEGSEARIELAMPRGSAVIIDEMDTDLWWRRKDPRTGVLEIIGRFNASHVNLSTSDTGVSCAVQFDDYRTVLGNRMVMRYLHPTAKPDPESMWNTGTKVTDILAWALPYNSRLDLSEVRGDHPYDLGTIKQPFTLPPGTLISDLMDNLNAISRKHWEWWIETPTSVNAAPKLKFAIGTRGQDKGVVLFDLGTGPTPIASWTRDSAADNYANSLYFTGGTGGVVETIPAQILQYGQRDAQDGNSSLGGLIKLIRQGAVRKLTKLADRTPTYTITLAHGFWRGRAHIDIGDTVKLIIRLGEELINTSYRVTELSVDVDENGLENVTLTLGKPLLSADPRSKRSPLMRLVRYLKNYNPPDGSADIPTLE